MLFENGRLIPKMGGKNLPKNFTPKGFYKYSKNPTILWLF